MPALLRTVLLFLCALHVASAQTLLRFAVIGDTGSGDSRQLAVARQMEAYYKKHRWQFVLMLGDNIYEDGNPRLFDRRFKQPYRNLIAAGVKFHAVLGNHDRVHALSRKGMAQVEDDAFGFVGRQDEYTFAAGPSVGGGKTLARFVALNSDAWLEELEKGRKLVEPRLSRLHEWLAQSDHYQWNFVMFHNPIYSFILSGPLAFFTLQRGHGPEELLRRVLEPEFRDRVDLVLCGHEHFYQKIRPQHGVHYLISGGGSRIRRGVDRSHRQVEFAAEVLHFVDFELSEKQLKYTAVSDKGVEFHSGVISK